jgi:hypothetical protein
MMEAIMRMGILAVAFLAAGSAFDSAKAADPYAWCAEYGGGGQGGGRNCYFVTLEQCRWAISGMTTSTCRPNPFYDGVPIDGPPAKRRARARP